MSEPTQDLLPLYDASRGFDTSMRGYDRAQVDREFGRMDDDLRATAAERDSAAARSADLAAQLASTQAQIESLRRQLRSASEAVTEDNVDERVRGLMQSAAAEAAKLRAAANAEAEQIRIGAADSAARTRAAAHAEAERIVDAATVRLAEAEETFRRRIAEAEQHRLDIETSLASSEQRTREDEARLTAEAHALRTTLDSEAEAQRNRLDAEALAERDRLNAEAQAQRDRLDSETEAERNRLDADSLAARTQVEEDFEITMRLRRTAAHHEQAEQKRNADELAARTVADARAESLQLIADATHEVRRLHAVRNGMHSDIDTLRTRLQEALDESLAATPDEPSLAPSARARPVPDAGAANAEATTDPV